jgi:hypothetical protein
MLLVLLGGTAGVFLALNNYPVFALTPLAALVAAGAWVIGVASCQDPQTIGIEVLGSAAVPQLSYLAASLTAQQSRFAQ